MQFLNPIWLWGLLGLSVPIAIHLLSRKEGKTIYIGSVRHLAESPTARFRHIKLNEKVLLALRCLLITIFVMMLAGFDSGFRDTKAKKWILVEPGAENDALTVPLIDSLTNLGFEARWLSRGFPSMTDDVTAQGGYWELMESLDAMPVDSAVVLSHNYLARFRGKRIPLPSNVMWITTEPGPIAGVAGWRLTSAEGTTWTRQLYSSPATTRFETRKVETQSVATARTLKVTILFDAAFEPDARIVQAAIDALSMATPHAVDLDIRPRKDSAWTRAGWLVWLSEEQAPSMDSLIAYNACPVGVSTVASASDLDPMCRSGNGSGNATWFITQRLNPAIALDAHLPLTFARILLPGVKDSIPDKRVLPEPVSWSDRQTTASGKRRPAADSPLLAGLFCLLLIGERWMSYKRNQ